MADVSLWLIKKFEEDLEPIWSEAGTFIEDTSALFTENAAKEGHIPLEYLGIGEEGMMRVKESDFQKEVESYLEQITGSGKIIQVIRDNGRNIVIMAMDAYNSLVGNNRK